jgi:hypothetical protein
MELLAQLVAEEPEVVLVVLVTYTLGMLAGGCYVASRRRSAQHAKFVRDSRFRYTGT